MRSLRHQGSSAISEMESLPLMMCVAGDRSPLPCAKICGSGICGSGAGLDGIVLSAAAAKRGARGLVTTRARCALVVVWPSRRFAIEFAVFLAWVRIDVFDDGCAAEAVRCAGFLLGVACAAAAFWRGDCLDAAVPVPLPGVFAAFLAAAVLVVPTPVVF